MIKEDIKGLEDVQRLIRSFYGKVLQDEILAHFFAYVKAHHWEEHLRVLDSFWMNLLFYTGGYEGNPLEVHKTLHHFKQLQKQDFERWLRLFYETVDELYSGEKAMQAKQRALSIATIMQIRILQ